MKKLPPSPLFRPLLRKTLLSFLCLASLNAAKAQTINTIAGISTSGYSGDGGLATAAKLNAPWAAKADAAGNVYIIDAYNNRLRKIDLSGNISTIAGTGTAGFGGDGGPATAAKLSTPYDLAIDPAGNIYIADNGNNRVRKINTLGVISTVVGNGSPAYSGDGGPATAAGMDGPACISFDPTGNMYIAVDGTRIRKVNTSGIISTFAGNGTHGFTGDGGAASSAKMNNPLGVACDASGNVFICDQLNNRVRKVNSAGIISTIAGTGTPSYTGDGGPATAATMNNPWGVALDAAGEILVSDHENNAIRLINAYGIMSTIAGTGVSGFSGDGGPATAAKLSKMWNLSVDSHDNVYIADGGNNRVRKMPITSVPVVNSNPHFADGPTKYLDVCINSSSDSINSQLTIIDADISQTETFTIYSAPGHGGLSPLGSVISTGGTITPSGLYYTPTSGYSGYDTFKVVVNDGYATDTATIYVTIDTLPIVDVITSGKEGVGSLCKNEKLLLSDKTGIGVWSISDTIATIATDGTLSCKHTGSATVSYTVVNGACTSSATLPVTIINCPSAVTNLSVDEDRLRIWPNPGQGAFTVKLPASYTDRNIVSVTNVLGVKIEEVIKTGAGEFEMSVKVPGVYFLSVMNVNGQRAVTRIVVD